MSPKKKAKARVRKVPAKREVFISPVTFNLLNDLLDANQAPEGTDAWHLQEFAKWQLQRVCLVPHA